MRQGLDEIWDQFVDWEDSNSSQPPFDWSQLSLGDHVSMVYFFFLLYFKESRLQVLRKANPHGDFSDHKWQRESQYFPPNEMGFVKSQYYIKIIL